MVWAREPAVGQGSAAPTRHYRRMVPANLQTADVSRAAVCNRHYVSSMLTAASATHVLAPEKMVVGRKRTLWNALMLPSSSATSRYSVLGLPGSLPDRYELAARGCTSAKCQPLAKTCAWSSASNAGSMYQAAGGVSAEEIGREALGH